MYSVEERFIVQQKYAKTDWKVYSHYPRGLSSLLDAQKAIEEAQKKR